MKHFKIIICVILSMNSNLRVTAQSLFSNAGFEQWDTIAGLYYQPRNWYTLNALTQAGFEMSTTITNDAHSGNYAAKLTSVEGVFNNIAGILCSGPLLDDNYLPDFNRLKRPYSLRPYAIKFHYKSFPAVSDTCALTMLLTKWNDNKKQADTIGLASFSTGDTSNEYKELVIPFEYFSNDIPDSAYFIATSSLDGFNPKPGSTFILDDLLVLLHQTSLNEKDAMKVSLYPNPSGDEININVSNITEPAVIIISDMSGRVVYKEKAELQNLMLPISSWASGMYIITIQTNRFTLRDKFLHQ
jgi:hypothetical protein